MTLTKSPFIALIALLGSSSVYADTLAIESDVPNNRPTANFIEFRISIGTFGVVGSDSSERFAYLQPEFSMAADLFSNFAVIADANVKTGFATGMEMAMTNTASADYGFATGLLYQIPLHPRLGLELKSEYRQNSSHFVSLLYAMRKTKGEDFDGKMFLAQVKTKRVLSGAKLRFRLSSWMNVAASGNAAWLSSDARWENEVSKVAYGAQINTETNLMALARVPALVELGLGVEDANSEDLKYFAVGGIYRSFGSLLRAGIDVTYAHAQFAAIFDSRQLNVGFGLRATY